jgi:hypothetical protein
MPLLISEAWGGIDGSYNRASSTIADDKGLANLQLRVRDLLCKLAPGSDGGTSISG